MRWAAIPAIVARGGKEDLVAVLLALEDAPRHSFAVVTNRPLVGAIVHKFLKLLHRGDVPFCAPDGIGGKSFWSYRLFL